VIIIPSKERESRSRVPSAGQNAPDDRNASRLRNWNSQGAKQAARQSFARRKKPAWTGGQRGEFLIADLLSSSDFNINAGAMISFSFLKLDTGLAVPVALLNDDIMITITITVTTDRHVGFPYAVFRAGRSHASFVANLNSARG
jgi:hypothetical protein